MSKHIVFRVDASEVIGIGHIMRCLVLAEQFIALGCKVTFISCTLSSEIRVRLTQLGISVLELPFVHDGKMDMGMDAKYTIDQLHLLKPIPDILIVDHYLVDYRWELQVRSFVNKIAVIDDLANRPHDCDYLLDQNYVLNMAQRYEGLVSPTCRLFLGPSYALLRTEFYIQPKRKRSWERLHRVLVTFGGSDPTDETLRMVKLIKQEHFPDLVFDVVVGALNPNKNLIKAICNQLENVNYYEDVLNMAYLINQADVCLGSPGISFWERSILGLPSILIVIAENQIETAKAIEADELALCLGWHAEVTDVSIVQTIRNLQHDLLPLKSISNSAEKMMNINYEENKINEDQLMLHPLVKDLIGGFK